MTRVQVIVSHCRRCLGKGIVHKYAQTGGLDPIKCPDCQGTGHLVTVAD